jgi:uncharacterized protein YjbJ (UPF0337 family)
LVWPWTLVLTVCELNKERSRELNLLRQTTCRRDMMDKDRIAGAAKQIKGKVKEGAGELTGDAKLNAEGKADQVEAKVQNTVGGLKDKAREALDD